MNKSLQLLNFVLTVWDLEVQPIAIIDEIISLEWVSNLNKAGTFTLSVPLSEANITALAVDNIITKNTYGEEGLKEACIITYRQITVNNQGIETLEVQGSTLLNWLSQRVLTQNYNLSDTIENIARNLVLNEAITPINSDRIIPNLELGEIKSLTDTTTFFPNSQYPQLLQALSNLFTGVYYGMEILMDTINKKFIFNVYQGIDRTISSTTNQPLLFSSEMNNIMSESYTHTKVNFNNVAYVYAQFESVGTSGTEINKTVTVGNAEGLQRFEVGVSGGSPTLNGQQFEVTESNYNTLLPIVGEQALAQAEVTHNFTGKLNMNCGLTYKRDFNVGDTITAINKAWNLNKDLVIVAVSEQYSVQGLQLSLTFGYPLPTILELINKQY